MKTKLAGIALVLLTALPLMAAQARVKGVVHLPLELQKGMPVVNVWIGTRGPYRFALDTNVKCALIVDKSLAKDLGLPHRGTEKILNPATRTMSPYEVVGVDRAFLGSAQFNGLNAIVDDIRGPFQVDGIVGFGMFANVLATLDLGNAELRVSRGALPRNGASVQRLKIFDGVPGVLLQAGGRYLFAAVNTEVPIALTVPKAMRQTMPLTGDIRAGTATLANARVAAIDNFPLANLGNAFLAQAVVTFDTAHARVAIEQAVAR